MAVDIHFQTKDK